MPASQSPKSKPAAATDRDGLELVWTTTLPLRKDSTNDLYHTSRAPFKPR